MSQFVVNVSMVIFSCDRGNIQMQQKERERETLVGAIPSQRFSYMIGTGCTAEGSGLDSRYGARYFFLFSAVSGPALRPNQSLMQLVPGGKLPEE
jgi:hypothetical protein